MFVERMIRNVISNKNLGLLIDEICQTIEKNNIRIKSITILSGPIRRGPDDCDESFVINSEDGKSMYFVYEQHGFAPPSNAYEFAKKLASRLNLFVDPFVASGYIRGYDQVSHYRLVQDDPKIEKQKEKQRWNNLKKC